MNVFHLYGAYILTQWFRCNGWFSLFHPAESYIHIRIHLHERLLNLYVFYYLKSIKRWFTNCTVDGISVQSHAMHMKKRRKTPELIQYEDFYWKFVKWVDFSSRTLHFWCTFKNHYSLEPKCVFFNEKKTHFFPFRYSFSISSLTCNV